MQGREAEHRSSHAESRTHKRRRPWTGPNGYATTDGVVQGGPAAYLVIPPSSEEGITPAQYQPPGKARRPRPGNAGAGTKFPR